jgi:hypothetical protein
MTGILRFTLGTVLTGHALAAAATSQLRSRVSSVLHFSVLWKENLLPLFYIVHYALPCSGKNPHLLLARR